jgi:aminodeoxyfutalosine deaminase
VSVAAATPTPVPDAVDRFLATAPKVELHLHLVGSASPASLAEAVTEGLTEGRRRAAALGVALALVYDIPGQMGEEGARATLAAALDHPPDGLVGFGLGGAEADVERRDFGWAFDRARAAGLASLPHAGEGDGPASVWAAVRHLAPARIGHGVRAIEDPALVEHLAAAAIPMEVCPTSNVCTRVVPSIEDHPVGALIDAGVVVTINSDDPPMFATTLTDEYRKVAAVCGLDAAGVAALVANGIAASFLPDDRKAALLAEVEATVAVHAREIRRPPGDE